MTEATPTRRVLSPCIGICTLDPRTRHCLGCKRSVDEIARWMTMDDRARQQVLDQLPSRQA